MQIEDVAGVGLATGRLAREQREFAMGHGVLRQVVEDDQRMLAAIAEIFRYREPGERRDPLQPWRGGCRGDDEHAAFRRAVLLHCFDDTPNCGGALADRHVYADQVRVLLVNDRVDADRSFANSAVADDEFALAAPDREHRVDGQYACVDRLGDEVALDDGRRWTLDRHLRLGLYRLVTVERPAERIDHPAEEPRSNRNSHDLTGPSHTGSCLDGVTVIEQDGADRIRVQSQSKTHSAPFEAEQFVETDVWQTGDKGDPVTDAFHAAQGFRLSRKVGRRDGLAAARQPVVARRVKRCLCHGAPTWI